MSERTGSLAWTGLSFILCSLADESVKKWIFIGLNQVGKLGVTIGFTIIYIWCAELFPTVIRTSMIGVSSMLSRIGSISAPYISDMVRLLTLHTHCHC